jgi:hypothetical protein
MAIATMEKRGRRAAADDPAADDPAADDPAADDPAADDPAADDPAAEARALLAEWKATEAEFRRIDRLDDYTDEEIDAATARQDDIFGRMGGLLARELGRDLAPGGGPLALAIDGWLFVLEHCNGQIQCDHVVRPGDALAIGGGR